MIIAMKPLKDQSGQILGSAVRLEIKKPFTSSQLRTELNNFSDTNVIAIFSFDQKKAEGEESKRVSLVVSWLRNDYQKEKF